MNNQTYNSVFDSPNNYSFLMGSSDEDLLNNQTTHIIRNIDNNIMDEPRSTNIVELDENLNKIKKNILLFLKNDLNDDEYYKNMEEELKEYEKNNSETNNLLSEPEPEPEPIIEKSNNELLVEKYKIFLKEYIKVQEDFLKTELKFKKNIEKTKKDVKLLNSAIEYTKILTNEYIKDSGDDIVKRIKEIGNIINKSNETYLIKKDYLEKRKNLNKYLDIIKSMNLNTNNTCSVCMTKPVNKYFNPCGHTCCSDCIDRIREYEGNNRLTCLICRVNIMDVRNIYFN